MIPRALNLLGVDIEPGDLEAGDKDSKEGYLVSHIIIVGLPILPSTVR